MANHNPQFEPLAGDERALLEALTLSASSVAHQARAVLLAAEGWPAADVAATLETDAGQVEGWLAAFTAARLAAFPEVELQAAAEVALRPSIAELCEQHDVDMAHGRHVGRAAAELFELTRPQHGLPERYRDVAYIAGLLHNVAYAAGHSKHHTRGRDILLETPLRDLSDADRRLVAVTTSFHRKSWKSRRLDDPAYAALSEDAQHVACVLAALVRIADGLDYSQSQTTILGASSITPHGISATVLGPYGDTDAARARQKSDMWYALFDVPFNISMYRGVVMPEPPAPPVAPAPDDETGAPRTPGVAAADPMSEAGRKVLGFHTQRMLRNEPGTRAGEDIEALHDMRVATRRMRAAFRVFAEYYEPDARKELMKGLQRTGGALGRVRDLDVFLEGAANYRVTLEAADQPAFDALLEHWRVQREAARQEMNAHLDSQDYQDFVAAMGSFVETAGAGALQPADGRIALVRHEAPRQIYDRYADVRRYETALADAPIATLHALRIDGKRLRYTLEFFRDALGAEGAEAISRVVGLQDHLGLLHDADVAAEMLRAQRQRLLEEDPQPRAGDLTAQLRALDGYLLDRETTREDLRRSFPSAWRSVTSPGMRRLLARAVSVL